MNLVWTNHFIGDVGACAAGVDSPPVIEESWTSSAPAPGS